ncbi:MAG: hypothetical protein IH612_09310 [Desulfofustis sp.]|nr:hypothetical protein [Desulfofustis sp.]
MKIQISKKEYLLLLDVFAIAEWVMNSHKVDSDPETEPYNKLEQKIMSYADDAGCGHLVKYDKKQEEYFPTREYEEIGTYGRFIEQFEEDVFWEELGQRLALRDLINDKGLEVVKEMDPVARMTAEDAIAETYQKEFYENGIEHLFLSEKIPN